MSTHVNTEYCSFTKAVEHLGDRWSLLILRELAMNGGSGFNALVAAIPGHISRSILTDRLRRLRDLGIVAHGGGADRSSYTLTEPGRALIPTLLAFNAWASGWLPEDPAFVARDPDIILAWLAERVEVSALPPRQVVVELHMRLDEERRSWLVLEAGVEPYGCLVDPLLDESRYVYVESGMPALLALANGRLDWRDALADGSIEAAGDPVLVGQLPTWFKHVAVTAVPVQTGSPPGPGPT